MQQRAGWGDLDFTATCSRNRSLQTIQHFGKIGAPYIAAIDHAERKHEMFRTVLQHGFQLLRCPDQIKMQAIHRQRKCGLQIVANCPEIGGEHDLQVRNQCL
ncbi:hypothetical protein D3C80_1545250 [compost metagenome]